MTPEAPLPAQPALRQYARTEETMEPPGHVRRLAAVLVDGLLLSCFMAVAVYAMTSVNSRGASLAILVLALVLAALYEPVFIAAMGATLGKRIMGLRVVNEYGDPVTVGQSIARWVSKMIFSCFVIPLAAPLFISRRRGLHDIVVSTYVIKV